MQTLTIVGASLCLSAALLSNSVFAEADIKIKITPDLAKVMVKHNGETVAIMRNQDKNHIIDPAYSKTSRACPPFCVTPTSIHPEVETIGELELLDYLQKADQGENVLVVDSREPEWLVRGTIPGAVSVPWMAISPRDAAPFETSEMATRDAILSQQFGAKKQAEGSWDFSNAKTLALFCNGLWCSQSLNNINTLIELGYPPAKLKWYRGGMQDWVMLGLTTVKAQH